MESKNGSDYSHNYDVTVKWIAEVLNGQTLEVIGVKSGIIEDVFGFEPIDIKVKSGRTDVMVRDERGFFYHIEEQRNLKKSDMYRFASYHFMAAKRWPMPTDIILASGNVYKGEKSIITSSGKYNPIVIDFSELDGRKRLEEIRHAVEEGTFENWLELVFLPLYGNESKDRLSETVEQIIRFETELFQSNKIPSVLLAATLIMSNKLIDKERLKEMWEDIKMLDIIDIAREEGKTIGKTLGIEEGKTLGLEEGKTLGLEEGKTLGLEEGKTIGLQKGKT